MYMAELRIYILNKTYFKTQNMCIYIYIYIYIYIDIKANTFKNKIQVKKV